MGLLGSKNGNDDEAMIGHLGIVNILILLFVWLYRVSVQSLYIDMLGYMLGRG